MRVAGSTGVSVSPWFSMPSSRGATPGRRATAPELTTSIALAGSGPAVRSSPATLMYRDDRTAIKPPCTSSAWFSTITGRCAAAPIAREAWPVRCDRCVDRPPSRRDRKDVEVAERRRGHLVSQHRREIPFARQPRARVAVEIDARVVFGRDRQLDALAGERQHPLLEGRVAVARELPVCTCVSIAAQPVGRPRGGSSTARGVAPFGQYPPRRGRRCIRSRGRRRSRSGPPAGCSRTRARAAVDHARPHGVRRVRHGAERHERAVLVGEVMRLGTAAPPGCSCTETSTVASVITSARGRSMRVTSPISTSSGPAPRPEMRSALRPSIERVRRKRQVADGVGLVRRQARDLPAVHVHAPRLLHVAMAQAHGPLAGFAVASKGSTSGGPLGLLGELVPLACGTEPQVVHPRGDEPDRPPARLRSAAPPDSAAVDRTALTTAGQARFIAPTTIARE